LVGGHVGWKYYEHGWKDRNNYGSVFTNLDYIGDGAESDNGFTGGVKLGYDLQFGCTVWGIQTDWNWVDVSASNSYVDIATAGQFDYSSDEKWYGTLRTRSGLVVNNLMLYLTGGLAFANFDRNLTYTNGAAVQTFSSDRTQLGFVVGAGTEWALSPNWSINSEFLYMSFEKDQQSFACSAAATCGGAATGTSFGYDFKDSQWVSRIGVNYRFGGLGW
jgi:outer membrane immunogenic protein